MTRDLSARRSTRKLIRSMVPGIERAMVLDVETEGHGSGRDMGNAKVKLATVGSGASPCHTGKLIVRDPAVQIAESIRAALDPSKANGPVSTLSTMSDEKRQEMERLYGGRVRGPVQPRKLQGRKLITAPVGRK